MFKIGQEVVCVNDDFSTVTLALYEKLPVKNSIYTIRDIVEGCLPTSVRESTKGSNPIFDGVRVETLYLEGLINKIDPISKKEKGFLSNRFVPLNPPEEEKVKERVEIKEPILQ